MRFLPALLLIAAPLLAQGATDEERRAEEARRADEEKKAEAAAAEKAAYDKAAEEATRLANQRSKWGMDERDLKKLLENLRSKSEATRAEAMDELKRVEARLDEMLPLIAEAMEKAGQVRGALDGLANDVTARTLFLVGGGGGGSEAISGTVDGTEYSLKSLGAGKYQLSATKRADDGKVMEQIEDQGTYAELQGKYAFLAAGLAVQFKVPALAVAPAAPLQVTLPARGLMGGGGRVWYANSADVACVAYDGGGRVGVSVCAPSEDLRFHLQLPEGAGFIVHQVVPGSRAEQIGIRRMDILLRLDGELIDSPVQLKKLHEKAGILEILRRSESKKIDLSTFPAWTPPEAPAAVDKPAAPPDAPAGAR